MRHWTECLPEGKRIYRDEVNEILQLNGEKNSLKLRLRLTELELNKSKNLLTQKVKKQYSKDEITKAIKEYESHFEQ